MDKQLRKMIGEEAAELLETADDKTLDENLYFVVCETCGQVFIQTTLRGARIMFRGVKSMGFMQPLIPFHWYLDACEHFVNTEYVHQVTAFVIGGVDLQVKDAEVQLPIMADKTKVKDLSSEWKSQFASQEKMVEAANRRKGENVSFKQAMLNEIAYMRRRADKAYGEN